MTGACAARLASPVAALALLAACGDDPEIKEAPRQLPTLALASMAMDALPSSDNAAPQKLSYRGELTQGGWITGQATAGTRSLRLGDTDVQLAPDGSFFAAFDRDAGGEAVLSGELADGSRFSEVLAVSPRAWNIEHVNVARRPGGAASEAFLARRMPELEAIAAARAQETGAQGWRQSFRWPVKGRISGRFGSQRVYRGEPGSYHSGLDIAPGAGTPFVAPADGVVVLAADDFSLEGKLLIIDHGQGLNSAFLHASQLMVQLGDRVTQGQHIGNVGASGRATGPHLHWSLKWHDARLDPLLFVSQQD